jgi:hypothetical protein
LFRVALRAIANEFASDLPDLDLSDRMVVYENRDRLYLCALAQLPRLYAVLRGTLEQWLRTHDGDDEFVRDALSVLAIDQALCPRGGRAHVLSQAFSFDAEQVAYHLNRMELPPKAAFAQSAQDSHSLRIAHPGGVGEVLKDPDGGSWFRGQIEQPKSAPTSPVTATGSEQLA